MRFYRVHYTYDAGVSGGFTYFTSKREAEKHKRELNKAALVENGDGGEIEVIEIEPTRGGILRALNLYAAHADNG
jgi:hypothetical protein